MSKPISLQQLLRCLAAASIIAASIIVAIALPAWPQAAGPIRIVVPVPAGGSLDILVRLIADQIGRTRGRTIVSEFRPGANSVIGTEAVSRAAPDGRTLLINAPSAFVIIPHLQKLNYDPLTSFEPICNLVTFPEAVVVDEASPYRTLADLVEAARARPGELTMASIGPASIVQIAFEMLRHAAHIDMTFVPYAGTAPAVNALLGRHVTAYFGNYRDVAEHIEAGKLRAIVTMSRARFAPLTQVPTIAESGYPDLVQEGWFGLFAPAKTPSETLANPQDWFSAAVAAPEIQDKLAAQGLFPVKMCGADFAGYIRKQYEDYGRVIRDANITLQ
jgi:tripartite-type tricarboxylate transporter receptor subunit TctC